LECAAAALTLEYQANINRRRDIGAPDRDIGAPDRAFPRRQGKGTIRPILTESPAPHARGRDDIPMGGRRWHEKILALR
jgi:hypothetical protein